MRLSSSLNAHFKNTWPSCVLYIFRVYNIYFQFKVDDSSLNGDFASLGHFHCDGQNCPEYCVKQMWQSFNWAETIEGSWKQDNTLRVECGENRIRIIVEKLLT